MVCLLALQVLTIIAPAQMQRGDMMGAASMLQSAFTLSKGLRDLPTMLSALHCSSEHYAQTGDLAMFDSNKHYAASKHAVYVQAIQHAIQTPLHNKIMQWQGFR